MKQLQELLAMRPLTEVLAHQVSKALDDIDMPADLRGDAKFVLSFNPHEGMSSHDVEAFIVSRRLTKYKHEILRAVYGN
jgi:hypothetical protein